jgi:hypothetical protein
MSMCVEAVLHAYPPFPLPPPSPPFFGDPPTPPPTNKQTTHRFSLSVSKGLP